MRRCHHRAGAGALPVGAGPGLGLHQQHRAAGPPARGADPRLRAQARSGPDRHPDHRRQPRHIIEDNLIQPAVAARGLTALRIGADARQRALIARGLVRFSGAPTTATPGCGAGDAPAVFERAARSARRHLRRPMKFHRRNAGGSDASGQHPLRILPLFGSNLAARAGRHGKSRISDPRDAAPIRNLLSEAAGNRGRRRHHRRQYGHPAARQVFPAGRHAFCRAGHRDRRRPQR